jgi:hypothetical protein
MLDWKKVLAESYNRTKKDIEVPKPDFYKTPNKTTLPNNAIFTGDKIPKSGDPSQVELNAWHLQNKEFSNDKAKEDKDSYRGSPLTSGNARKENVENQIKKKFSWIEVLSNISIERKPDGNIKVLVEENTTPSTELSQVQTPQQESQHNQGIQSKEKSSSNQVNSWVIKKNSNFSLVGKECKDYCGIGIYENGKEVEFYKVAKNGHSFEEIIPQGKWETRFDELVGELSK